LTEVNGTAERSTTLDMIEDNARPGNTMGGDKNYDTADFVAGCRKRGCTPHVPQNDSNRRSAIGARTIRHPGHRISTIKRRRIEEPFGWMKTVVCARLGIVDAAWRLRSPRSRLKTPALCLLYTLRNGDALEARERVQSSGDTVVVGSSSAALGSAIDRTPSKPCWGTKSPHLELA
jgi:hypothetical protein